MSLLHNEKFFHRSARIESIEINGRECKEVEHVISTLPLDQMLSMLHPLPPSEILKAAERLQYRHIILNFLHNPVHFIPVRVLEQFTPAVDVY